VRALQALGLKTYIDLREPAADAEPAFGAVFDQVSDARRAPSAPSAPFKPADPCVERCSP
jgi:hypothetical protein